MENIIIDLKFQIQSLEEENVALKRKIVLMYENWNYDNKRFQELKESCNLQSTKTRLPHS